MAHAAPKLPVKTPVPSDIDIAQAFEPVHIGQIAKDVGLLESELDYYGSHKAKASAHCIGCPGGPGVALAGRCP